MPDDTANLNFQATLNTDEVKSGASEAVSALEDVGEAGRGMSTKTVEQTANVLDSLVKVRDTVQALQGLLSGGDFAMTDLLGGVEVLASMLGPEGELAAGVIAITSSLIGLASGSDGAEGAAARHAAAEQRAAEMSGAWATANTELGKSLSDIDKTTSFSGILTSARQFTEQLHIQEDAANSLKAALDRLADAKFGQQEAALNLKEQVELHGKAGQDAEQIRFKYDKQRVTLQSQHGQVVAQRDLNQKKEELAQLQSQKEALLNAEHEADVNLANEHKATSPGATGASLGQSDYEFARDTIQKLQQQKEDAANGVQTLGKDSLGFDTYVPTPPLTPAQWVQLQTLNSALPKLKKEDSEKGHQYNDQIKNLTDQRASLQAEENKALEDVSKGNYEAVPGWSAQQNVAYYSENITKYFGPKFDEIDQMLQAYAKTQAGYATVDAAQNRDSQVHAEDDPKIAEINGKMDALQKGDIPAAEVNLETTKMEDGALLPANVPASSDTSIQSQQDNQSAQAGSATMPGDPGAQVSPGQQIAPTPPPANEPPPLLLPLVERSTTGAQAMQAATQAHAQLASSLQSFTDEGQQLAEMMTDLARATDKATKALGHRISVAECAINSLKNSHF